MKRRTIIDIFLRVILPFLLGGIIYIVFRSERLIMFKWFEAFELNELTNILRQNSVYTLPNWIKYNLPDALWLYSLTSILIIIWKREINKTNFFYFLLPLIIGIFWELGQYLKVIHGTFDIKDIIFYMTASFFAFQNIKHNFFKLKIKNNIV